MIIRKEIFRDGDCRHLVEIKEELNRPFPFSIWLDNVWQGSYPTKEQADAHVNKHILHREVTA